jgi:hypothetical protein
MRDYQIRAALRKNILRSKNNSIDLSVLDEVVIGHGITRIDLLIVNGDLHGFELKSDRDTLARLQHQVRLYNQVLNRATLVVGYHHAYEALKMVPEWWGVKLVHQGKNGAIHFQEARRPDRNPSREVLSLSKLLWREEALALLKDYGLADGFERKIRREIYTRVANTIPIDIIQSRVCYHLQHRSY